MHDAQEKAPTNVVPLSKPRNKKGKNEKILWVAVGSLTLACFSITGLFMLISADEPGIKDPVSKRILAEKAVQQTYENNAKALNEKLLRADFSANYIGENVEPGLLQQSTAMHARMRRADIIKETTSIESPWAGRTTDAVAYSAIRNNLKLMEHQNYSGNPVTVIFKNAEGEKVEKIYSSAMGTHILLADTQALMMTQYLQNDSNFDFSLSLDNLKADIKEFQESKGRYLTVRGYQAPGKEINSIAAVEAEVKAKAEAQKKEEGIVNGGK